MNKQDLKESKVYRIEDASKTPFIRSLTSKNILEKYKFYSDLNGKQIILLSKENPKKQSNNIQYIGVKIYVKHPDCWLYISESVLKEVKVPDICFCNLWVTGCKCGVFKREKNEEKSTRI